MLKNTKDLKRNWCNFKKKTNPIKKCPKSNLLRTSIAKWILWLELKNFRLKWKILNSNSFSLKLSLLLYQKNLTGLRLNVIINNFLKSLYRFLRLIQDKYFELLPVWKCKIGNIRLCKVRIVKERHYTKFLLHKSLRFPRVQRKSQQRKGAKYQLILLNLTTWFQQQCHVRNSVSFSLLFSTQ